MGTKVLARACAVILLAWGRSHQDTMECVTMGLPTQDTRGKIRLLEAGRTVGYFGGTYEALGTLTPDGTTLD